MNFKPGDVVKLKSGGPVMTVERVETESENRVFVYCVWFDDKHKQVRGHFSPAALESWS
jgi:uncharacterized protein YodC (DUF2158 family)